MIDTSFKKVLKIISERMQINSIRWAVIGSTNLALQGIEILPNDIDIVILVENLPKIKNIFAEYEVSDVEELRSTTEKPWWRVKFVIDNIHVEILSEEISEVYARGLFSGKIIEILLDSRRIPCLALDLEAQAYKEMGRNTKVELIEKFLKT